MKKEEDNHLHYCLFRPKHKIIIEPLDHNEQGAACFTYCNIPQQVSYYKAISWVLWPVLHSSSKVEQTMLLPSKYFAYIHAYSSIFTNPLFSLSANICSYFLSANTYRKPQISEHFIHSPFMYCKSCMSYNPILQDF